jgi:tyrocidine synthetase-3
MTALILDSKLNPVPKGVVGNLYLAGTGLANGYENLSELTETKFTDNPFAPGTKMYQTGDLARINSAGEIEYLGRIDEQIKLRGFRLELTDIEANLLKHEGIENTAVVLLGHEKSIPENEVVNRSEYGLHSNYPDTDFNENGLKLVGYYTGPTKIPSAELAKYLKQELPEYMIPTSFKYIEELPLTKNGKVDKSALKSLKTSELDTDTPFVAPNGEIEELVAEIWKEVLRLKQVSVHDNFIALGGHSLAAIRVTARINEEIEMKFPLNKIFEFPTIVEYGTYIEETLEKLLNEQN